MGGFVRGVPAVATPQASIRYEAVPRFYFHLFNDMTSIDEEGAVLPNAAVALQKGATIAREMAAESVREGHLVLDHRIEVADEQGETVGVIRFADVVQVKQTASA
jgi:hypothetical protein